MTIGIRLCTESDIAAVRDLLARTWHDTYDAFYGAEKVAEITSAWHSVPQLMRQLDEALALFLVAERGGALVGTAKATGLADGSIRLDRLYVDPAEQRAGAGAALLAAVQAAFPFATCIDLEVEPRNARARAFYGKHGFTALGASSDCGRATGIPAKTMRKRLADGTGLALMVRPVRDGDAQDLIGLVTLCFAEYPGCYFDPHGDMPDIFRPARSKLALEGRFLVVEDAHGRVGACIGVDLPTVETAEIHRLYVRPDLRGRGLAKRLTRLVEDFAAERGARRIILWSDTRFTLAHRLYERLGYARGVTRSLGDISQSREFFFDKALPPAGSVA